jgi:hypothetical protein
MTKRQLEILQHSLGVDQYGQGHVYRNRFCASGDDEAVCRELVALGYMQQHRTTELFPYFNCSVTEAGKRTMFAESPKPTKLTRSQQRYRRFLEADLGISFTEWLKDVEPELRKGVRP